MKLEISTPQLSFGLHSDDVVRVQQAIQALGRDIPIDETDRRLFGPGTAAVLKALQTDFGVPATGVVDAATVTAINAALAKLATGARTIRGWVSDADGNPAKGLSVQLYLEDSTGEKVIGKSALDADGGYQISYQPPENSARIDLRIEVRDQSTAVETTPPSSSILASAGSLEVVNFVLSGAAHPQSSEFDLVLADLKPLLGSRDPAQLKEDAKNHEASLLAVQSGWPPAQVAALAIASRLASETKVPAQLFYGLLREGCPGDLAALQAMHPDVQLSRRR
jgi:peptidoglycan hydrolase-like protein with peptidoglycan-binding domain